MIVSTERHVGKICYHVVGLFLVRIFEARPSHVSHLSLPNVQRAFHHLWQDEGEWHIDVTLAADNDRCLRVPVCLPRVCPLVRYPCWSEKTY